MKILWAISNWKRTGPLEPSLDLAGALQGRGHEIVLLLGAGPAGSKDREHEGDAAARSRGLAPLRSEVSLHKHAAPFRNAADARRLRRLLARERPDVVVSTLANDHALLWRADRGHTPLVRLCFDAEEPATARHLKLLVRSARTVVFSEALRRALVARAPAAEHLVRLDPPLDIEALRAQVDPAFDPSEAFHLPEGAFRFGVVARMQRHRRFGLLWEAVSRLRSIRADFVLLPLGRGTHEEQVAREPVRRLALEEVVRFPGYLRGREYASTLAQLNAQLFLVPGSDGTCRALREGMALGVPSLALPRGMLPELVDEGATGWIVPEDPVALADAMRRFLESPLAARSMGERARGRAERFAAGRVAARLETVLQGAVDERFETARV